jgi:hypothetical protein
LFLIGYDFQDVNLRKYRVIISKCIAKVVCMNVSLNIPKNIYLAMKVPDKQKDETLLRELALTLYEQGILSFGKAR